MSQLPDPRVLDQVLRQWDKEADRGKDASFSDWTFFDTNCLSELVKLVRAGEKARVHRFVSGRDVLIPSTVLQELRRAPDIAEEVPNALATAALYLLPHPTKFWDCDVWNFLNNQGIRRNVLEAYPLPAPVFRMLNSYAPLQAAWKRAETRAGSDFLAQIERDRGVGVDERKLGALVWGKINEIARKEYKGEIPMANCRPHDFPSFFVYYYAYYFRSLASAKIAPGPNDFIDLAHAIIAPYCRDFFVENKLAMLLRKQVQGRIAPTPYATAKRLTAERIMDAAAHERARRSADMRHDNQPLLPNTSIWTFTELRAAVLAT